MSSTTPVIERTLSLHTHRRHAPYETLQRLLAWMQPDTPSMGPRGPVAQLEERMARMLGKAAALFFPTGTMAQQVALRLHAEQRGRTTFVGHPQNHLVAWEEDGYSIVHGLRFQPAGDPHELMTLADLERVSVPPAALILELPQRDLGGQLPTWEELGRQIAWARGRGAAVHMDGARLWEAQTFYERPHAEIAEPFDTVYVSLYKALRGVRGAVLAGSADFIAEASVWRTRLGGDIGNAWPLAATAMIGLDTLLPRMMEFRDHAIAIAAAINADGMAHTVPSRPQTPLFHVHLPAPRAAMDRVGAEVLAERGIQLFTRAFSTPDERRSYFEISVGENAMDFTAREVASLVREFIERASKASPDKV